jgi:transporter family protein
MPIAFTSPLFGALMGSCLGGETLSLRGAVGILLATGGIVLLTVD